MAPGGPPSADPRLYAECHGDTLATVKNHAMLVAVAGLAVGCAAAVAATMIPGVPQQVVVNGIAIPRRKG